MKREQAECLEAAPVRLNLGAGEQPIEGWHNLDAKTGQSIYPLDLPDNSVEEIRASHVLEHYGHAEVLPVLREWVRVLKPCGKLRIAVPDLETIAKAYLSGAHWPIQGYLMGGQTDALDFHKSAFDREALCEVMRAAGLVALHPWRSEIKDCAALDVSLNVAGYKRPTRWPNVSAAMSVPRLGFMDNFFAAFQALVPLGIKLRKTGGAFWGQCLTRAFEGALAEEDPEWILAIDYDTVYQRRDVEDLIVLAMAHPEADAIAPLQQSRSKESPLMYIEDASGKPRGQISHEELSQPLLPVTTAHFGLTLIRADKLRALEKPWFHSVPDAQGSWGEGRIDDDIWFWHQWRRAGHKLAVATRVVVGHAELMLRWPDESMQPTHQLPSDYWRDGPPKDAWT